MEAEVLGFEDFDTRGRVGSVVDGGTRCGVERVEAGGYGVHAEGRGISCWWVIEGRWCIYP